MQTVVAVAAALGLASMTGPVMAQPASPGADLGMPGVSGYSHPEIGPDACKVVNPGQTECIIPAMSAGEYVVDAAGTSTADAAGANQTIVIAGKGWRCGQATTQQAWSSGPRTFHFDCVLTVLTDEPLAVEAVYADSHATKDPKGVVVTIRRLSWNGVISAIEAGGAVVTPK